MPPLATLTADSIAERVTRWRPLPNSLHALLALRHDDPDADSRMVEIVRSDPDLDRGMQVLGSVSPYVDGKGRSATSTAIRQIGYRRIHAAAVAVLVVDTLAADASEIDFMDYWRNAAAAGALASTLADVERSEARDLAYVGGMLHRVGLLGLDMVAPDALARLHDAILDEGWSEALEESVLGFTVREVTAALHVKWRLPVELAEAHLVINQPALWATRPVARVLWETSRAIAAVGVADPLHSTGTTAEEGVSPQVRRVLDRFFNGGADLVKQAEGLIGACLLARFEENAASA